MTALPTTTGLSTHGGNAIAFDQDSSYFLLCSLEVLDEEGGLKRKADLFSPNAPSAATGLPKEWTRRWKRWPCPSGEKARVDMAYMGAAHWQGRG